MLRSLLLCVFIASLARAETNRFPNDFLFGVASSAYQVEGAWNLDGKGPSIWDEYTHSHPEKILDGSNGDVGPNSYEYYLDDIAAVKNLNMSHYRFSIAWSRVLPTGDISNVNEKGIEYYNKIIDKLVEQNIEPMITMFHFDLPQKLQIFGGFSNSAIVEYFEEYAYLLFDRFGDRVKYWITFNEPNPFCLAGYGGGGIPPAMNLNGVGEYLCAHNVLKAHGVTYRLYKKLFFDRYKGQIGITLNTQYFYSETNDTQTVDKALRFMLGWFANPIFSSEGNYPDVMIKQIAKNSEKEGRHNSRLPTFSKRWIEIIRGSADFLGYNYYTSYFVEAQTQGANPSFERDSGVRRFKKLIGKCTESDVFCSVPQGLDDILRWIKEEYNNLKVIITENGWSDKGEMEDNERIEYLHDHLKVVQRIVLNNHCNLMGYTVWSIIDNFEWASGYTEKFGLYSVNMTSPRRERTPRKSAIFMKQVTTTRQIPKLY